MLKNTKAFSGCSVDDIDAAMDELKAKSITFEHHFPEF
jgi:hypothetical protein